ncbi:MAG: dihydropteroate synthase [Acutalibacteraceae bacterium]
MQKIIATAETYGIPKTDLIFDVLAMTISAEQEAAAVTLKALQLIRDELGAYTSLGVSNISFGLPQRENINAAFLPWLCKRIKRGYYESRFTRYDESILLLLCTKRC